MIPKKDFKIYSYHAACPNCKNYNTRLNKALKSQYALCYTCSLVFKLTDEEIKNFTTPLDLKIGIHQDLDTFYPEEIEFINKINNINKIENNIYNNLHSEVRNHTVSLLNNLNKNCLIISDHLNNENISEKINFISNGNIQNIEKEIYTNILKKGKIDLLIIENLQNITLSSLLDLIQHSMAKNGDIYVYIPNINNIYQLYYKYITDSKFIHNIYTACHTLNKFKYNIHNINDLDNHFVLHANLSSISSKDFNNYLQDIVNKQNKNIIYSEPIFLAH